MTDSIAQRISTAIEPLVGKVLAGVTVEVESRRLGKDPVDLSYHDVPRISVAIEQHLVSFVGAEVAQAAATRVRQIEPIV